MPKPHNILLLAFPNGQLLDIAGPLQMFAGANDELARRAYRIEIAATHAGPFTTSSGVRLVADLAFAQITNRRLARTDTLITVGGEPGMRQELARGSLTAIIFRASGRVPRIASVCTGTFFLAAAGVLDGRRAATHWSEVDALKRFRPAVLVDGDAIHIEDGGIWTSAGVTAGMDLALAMIEADLGRKVALAIARRHVVFRIRPGGQSQFSAELAAQSAGNPKLHRLAERVTAHPRADWRTDALAADIGMSQRSLSRLSAKRGVRLLTAAGDDLTDSDDLGRKMMRQVAGAFMEYEKGRLVAKLRGAWERKRKETGKKVGGRKSHSELWPEVVAEARRLRRAKGKAGRLSYREISARLKDD
jgi:transcriptional regulator GlxA family with amidase domain